MATRDLTTENLASTIEQPGIVLVDFWAEWCGPCKAFARVYDAASEKHPDVVFGKVDTEDQRELAAAFDIRAIPTLAAFKDGVLVFLQPGMLPPAAVEELIRKLRALDMVEVKTRVAEARPAETP